MIRSGLSDFILLIESVFVPPIFGVLLNLLAG